MPIQLNAPLAFDPGHGRTPELYAQVKIAEVVVSDEERCIRVRMQYGNTVGARWMPGQIPQAIFTFADTPPQQINGVNYPAKTDFSALVGAAVATNADEQQPGDGGFRVYRGLRRALYEQLLTSGRYQGVYT